MLRHSLSVSDPIHSNSDLLTQAEAASFLGLEAKTLAIWRSTKRYPLAYIKVGRLVRYYRADLLEFLENRRVPGT